MAPKKHFEFENSLEAQRKFEKFSVLTWALKDLIKDQKVTDILSQEEFFEKWERLESNQKRIALARIWSEHFDGIKFNPINKEEEKMRKKVMDEESGGHWEPHHERSVTSFVVAFLLDESRLKEITRGTLKYLSAPNEFRQFIQEQRPLEGKKIYEIGGGFIEALAGSGASLKNACKTTTVNLDNYQAIFPEEADATFTSYLFDEASGISRTRDYPSVQDDDVKDISGARELYAVIFNLLKEGGLSINLGATLGSKEGLGLKDKFSKDYPSDLFEHLGMTYIKNSNTVDVNLKISLGGANDKYALTFDTNSKKWTIERSR